MLRKESNVKSKARSYTFSLEDVEPEKEVCVLGVEDRLEAQELGNKVGADRVFLVTGGRETVPG